MEKSKSKKKRSRIEDKVIRNHEFRIPRTPATMQQMFDEGSHIPSKQNRRRASHSQGSKPERADTSGAKTMAASEDMDCVQELGDFRYRVLEDGKETIHTIESLKDLFPGYAAVVEEYARDEELPTEMLHSLLSIVVWSFNLKDHKHIRYSMYRKFAEAMGWSERTPLPKIVELAIKDIWPAPDRKYTGFKLAE